MIYNFAVSRFQNSCKINNIETYFAYVGLMFRHYVTRMLTVVSTYKSKGLNLYVDTAVYFRYTYHIFEINTYDFHYPVTRRYCT